jgi:hypothetical protein
LVDYRCPVTTPRPQRTTNRMSAASRRPP